MLEELRSFALEKEVISGRLLGVEGEVNAINARLVRVLQDFIPRNLSEYEEWKHTWAEVQDAGIQVTLKEPPRRVREKDEPRDILRRQVRGAAQMGPADAKCIVAWCKEKSGSPWNHFEVLTAGLFSGDGHRDKCSELWDRVKTWKRSAKEPRMQRGHAKGAVRASSSIASR